MIPGLNHNVRYRDLVFHVQTEDSGAPRCQLTTHVFHEGSVLAHTRSPYSADIMSLAGDARGPAVKKQMQEQHKALLKQLVSGALDPALIKHRIIPGEPDDGLPASDSIPAGPPAAGETAAPATRPARPRSITPAHAAVLDATVATPLDEASSIDLEVEIDLSSLAAGPSETSPVPSLSPALAIQAAGLDTRPTDPARASARGAPHEGEDSAGPLSGAAGPRPVLAVDLPESEAVLTPGAPSAVSSVAGAPETPVRTATEPAAADTSREPAAHDPAPAKVEALAPPLPIADTRAKAVDVPPNTAAPPRGEVAVESSARRGGTAGRAPAPAALTPPVAPSSAPNMGPAVTPPTPAGTAASAGRAAPAPVAPPGTSAVGPPAAKATAPAPSGRAPVRASGTPPAATASRAPQVPPAAAPRTLHASLAQAAGREPPAPPPSSAPQSWNEATPPHMRTSLPGVDDTDLLGRLAPVPLAEVADAPAPASRSPVPVSRSPAPVSRSPAPVSRSPRPIDEAAALRELVPAPLRVDAVPTTGGRQDPQRRVAGGEARREATTDALGVPPADTSGAWLRARPPIHLDPALPVVSSPSSGGATVPEAPAVPRAGAVGSPSGTAGDARRKPNVRPQTRPPSSIRAPLVEPSRAVTEEHATHAYGRTLAERPATAREIDASVRRTSAPPPMGIPDARTERIVHPRPPPLRPPSVLDHEADTHLDLRAIPPEFIASVLADRGTGDLIADLSLANPSWAPGRSLTRPPPPPVPDELLEAADPTIDEILLGLSPTDDELIGDPRSPGAMSSPLADAAWLDPELSLAATPRPQLPTAPRAPGIAPPSAWATERSTQTTGRTLPPGPPPGGRGPNKPSDLADATLLDLPREELQALRAGALPPLPPQTEQRARGDTSGRGSPAPVRGRPVTPPTGPISPAPTPAPASTRPGPATSRPQGSAPSRAMSSPRRGASNAAPPGTPRTGDLPSRNSTSAREESAIRRVDDPSLDDIIQGYLDTKKRR